MKKYTIKPLVWVQDPAEKTFYDASPPGYLFTVHLSNDDTWALRAESLGWKQKRYGISRLDDAKLAAEEWYITRLTAALDEVKEEA